MSTLIAFLVALAILIAVHEWGHFWVARRCGVKVLRFSLGFGPVLFSRRDKQGTEFSLSAIPLGGYVRFVDQRDPDYDAADEAVSYNRRPVWQRMAIVSAGPLANFILAILLYAVINLQGVSTFSPIAGQPYPDSFLAQQGLQPGDLIVAIDHQPVEDWRELSLNLANRLGTSGELHIAWLDAQGQRQEAVKPLDRWLSRERDPDPMQVIGLRTWNQAPPAVLGELVEGGAAQQAGLQQGDQIISFAQQPVDDWGHLLGLMSNNEQSNVELQVMRQGLIWPYQLELQPSDGRLLMGAQLQVPQAILDSRQMASVGTVEAVQLAVSDTLELISLSLRFIVRMVSGNLSVQNLSGPVTIAQLAGESASYGWISFLSFLAFISISLGIVNLLPLPVLDGGHLVLLAAEGIRGRPMSERFEQAYAFLGTVLLLALMSFAIINDFFRLFS